MNGQLNIDNFTERVDQGPPAELETNTVRREKPLCAGVYVKGLLQGEEVTFTIDTGATRTIVSTRVYYRLPEGSRPELMGNSRSHLSCADGRPIKYEGMANFEVALGPLEMNRKFTVADITDDVLLGADIIQNGDGGPADLLLSEGYMILNGIAIPLEQVGMPMRVRKAFLADDYVIPGMSEAILDVFVDREECCDNGDTVIIEPLEQFNEKYSLVMASSLVDVANNTTVKVRVMNPFPNSVSLKQNTVVGSVEKIDDEVETLLDAENTDELNNFSCIRRISLQSPSNHTNCVTRQVHEAKTPTDSQIIPPHLEDLFDSIKERDQDEKDAVAKLLCKYQDVFSKDEYDLGLTHLTEHVIDTGDARPVKQPPRRVPLAYAGEDKKALEKLLKQGSVRPSTSPWASPIVLIRKKDGSVRPCVDYRRVNFLCRKDAFPLPRVEDCIDAVQGAVLFSTLDITSAYNQIPVREEDIPKTAFVTKHGLFEYTTMPFGLCNSPATFQRLIELVLSGLQWNCCLIYLDDVIVFGRSFDEHTKRLEVVLQRFREARLKLKPSKCHILQERVVFLGHVITKEGVLPNPANVEKLVNWPTPVNVSDVRAILGMGSYYRRFVKDFSQLVNPIVQLTKKSQRFKWTSECQRAFEELKRALTGPSVMGYPRDDCKFILDTDACDVSIGAVLSQIQQGRERVIAYASRTLNKAERNYCVTDRELLAVKHFTEHFKHYLLGRNFVIRTDHQALKWLFSLRDPKNRIARWIEILSAYDFVIEYRAGKQHGNADGMSRCPNPRNCTCEHSDDNSLRCGPCRKCEKRMVDMQSAYIKAETEDQHLRRAISKDDTYSGSISSVHWVYSNMVIYFWWLLNILGLWNVCGLGNAHSHREYCSRTKSSLSSHTARSMKDTNGGNISSVHWVYSNMVTYFWWFLNILGLWNVCGLGNAHSHIEYCSKTKSSRSSDIEFVSSGDGDTRLKSIACKLPAISKLYSYVGNALTLGRGWARIRRVDTRSNTSWVSGFSMETLRKKQQDDPDIGPIMRWMKKGKRPYGAEVCASSPATRNYWNCWDCLQLNNGILYRRYLHKNTTESYFQFIVPRCMKNTVLHQVHNILLSGHLGKKKTIEKVRRKFYWWKLSEDVASWIRKCDICAANKAPQRKPRSGLGDMRVGAPMDRLATDILGPLPETPRGNKYILVVTDYFSNWVEIFPIPDQTAPTCANKILNEIISRFGCPLDLHSDQGTNYQSEIFAELCRLLEIRKTRTTARNPKCNGKVERFNHTLIRMIRAYIKGQQRDWDLNLGCLAGAYRATPHDVTGFTPNYLMLGREVTIPGEIIYGNKSMPEGECISEYVCYVDNLRERMQRGHDLAREWLEKIAIRQKRRYDGKMMLNKYRPGDYVWYLLQTRKLGESPKLKFPYGGPYVVIHKLNDLDYVIQMDSKGNKKVVHHDKLKPYQGTLTLKWAHIAVRNAKRQGLPSPDKLMM